MWLSARAIALTLVFAGCSVGNIPAEDTPDVGDAPGSTVDQPAPRADLDQFLAELENELADNPGYAWMKGQMDEVGINEQAGRGFSHIGESYCEEYREDGVEAVVRKLGYDFGQSGHLVGMFDQVRDLGGTSEDVVVADLVDLFLAVFWAADQWLCPSLGMGDATDLLEEDEGLRLMNEGQARFTGEQAFSREIEFMKMPDPAMGYFGWGIELSDDQWIDLGWLACALVAEQSERSFFAVKQSVGLAALDAEPSVGADAPGFASSALAIGVEHLCPEYLGEYEVWDGAPDGPLAVLLDTALRNAIVVLEDSIGAGLGDGPVSYEVVQTLHPVLGEVSPEQVFFEHVFLRHAPELDVSGSALEAVGSAYEFVWASGLMQKDAPVSDLADAAAAITIALATQELPDLLAILEAEHCTRVRC